MKIAIAGLVVLSLALPGQARASQSYSGTSGNDVIYFGYCASCHNGGPGVRICGQTGAGAAINTTRPLDAGTLTLNGLDGNDQIRAADNETAAGCRFDSLSLLTFSQVRINGGNGDDTLIAGRGDQILDGGAGNDFLSGYGGNDELYGGYGNDVLIGDQGADELYGEDGDDILIGGTGDDLINGGPGNDTFRCRLPATPDPTYDGADWASDCGDTIPRVGIELVQQRDPYREWAFRLRSKRGVTHDDQTTSSPHLLLSDRSAGAAILVSWGADLPVVGDFDGDGRADDLAAFRSGSHTWGFDYNHDGTSDRNHSWGATGDRPVAGDFDGDGRLDDVALFRPSDRTWRFDYDANGSTNETRGPWGNPGDVPIAGDFDGDGRVDDVAVFRPATGIWYYDYNHNGTTDATSGPWALTGDIPIAGDFDGDGRADDVAVFRRSTGIWYYDYNHNGTTDATSGPLGTVNSIPVAGDFDSDGRLDDVGFVRLEDRSWSYDYNHNGTTDATGPAWSFVGEPRGVSHKQYGATCGPASLNIVMEHLGLANHGTPVAGSVDLDGGGAGRDLGYHLSMEHLMYVGYKRYRALGRPGWAAAIPGFMDAGGVLDTTLAGAGAFYQIRYDLGAVDYNATTGVTTGQLERWIENGPAVGTDCSGAGCREAGLPWVANQFPLAGHADAIPLNAETGFASLDHLKAVIKGLVDNNLAAVVGVDDGGHFNTLIGYWQQSDGFYIYTADPLDGWGQPFYLKPMRWRKIKLDAAALPSGAASLVMLMPFGHGQSCSGGWASQLDATYGATLCGYF
jgi:hypothetical protein